MSVAVAVQARVRLAAVDLCHRWAPGRELLPVRFELASPGVAAVTGPNGSGKSTLLRIVAGLLRPSGGSLEVVVGDRALLPGDRIGQVGYAAPELHFYDELEVQENLDFALEALGADDRRARVEGALARVGLAARRGDRVQALSSGMQQRLRLAFALLPRAPLLLLDEPGAHLDEEGRERLARIVQEERGQALVMIATNDPGEVRFADTRLALRGRGLGHPA